MIISGNSNVNTFKQQGMATTAASESTSVVWVGALTAKDFFNGHPAGHKVRELFGREPGWKFLSMGIHDVFELCASALQWRLTESLAQTRDLYTRIFRELGADGKLGWLVFPQPAHEVNFPGLGPDEVLSIAQNFNAQIEQWCLSEGIAVVNPLERILGPDGRPLPHFLQKDGIHLNADAAKLYLEEMSRLSGIELTFRKDTPLFEPHNEPESYCSLILNALNVPFERGITGAELETELVDFVSGLLEEKGLDLEIDARTELVDSGLMDSLNLVETYNHAVNAIKMEIDFDVDLRSLDTVEKICQFLSDRYGLGASKKEPIFADFITSLRGDFADAEQRQAILEADYRIASMDTDRVEAFIEHFGVVSREYNCNYGIIYFWLALWAAEKRNYASALELGDHASNSKIAYLFSGPHVDYYLDRWRQLARLSGQSCAAPVVPAAPAETGRQPEPGAAGASDAAAPGPQAAGVAACCKAPRISLVIPSFNYARYLEACLDSILSQNYPNLELIVMDGGSTDGSVEILKRHEKYFSFWRSHPDAGNYSAIEEGLRRSSGELQAWLNADDMFHPGAFRTVAEIFSKEPEVEWLMGRPNSFDEAGNQKVVLSFLPLNSRARYLADQELIQQEGVFWRRGLWERSGSSLDTSLLLAADLELWARFFRSAQLYSVDTLIAGFRDHPLQKSKDKAGYTAEANLVLAREMEIFRRELRPFSPPAPLPILVSQ